MNFEEWKSKGKTEQVLLRGRERQIFILKIGDQRDKPWITLLHGFPTCSWDYSKVLPDLIPHFNVITFDFLGFGLSDKPTNHEYSIDEQTDLVEAVWKAHHIDATFILSHDYAVSVCQELLARQNEFKLKVRLNSVIFMNGGLYSNLHKPLVLQKLLSSSLGAVVTRLITQKIFSKNMRKVFSPQHQPTDEELNQHWKFLCEKRGHRLYHRLIHYIRDRVKNGARWRKSLEETEIPLGFIWGLADPISGQHVFDYLKEQIPNAYFLSLQDVGHFPHLEEPQLIGQEVVRHFLKR